MARFCVEPTQGGGDERRRLIQSRKSYKGLVVHTYNLYIDMAETERLYVAGPAAAAAGGNGNKGQVCAMMDTQARSDGVDDHDVMMMLLFDDDVR